jgi:hypothetical protein
MQIIKDQAKELPAQQPALGTAVVALMKQQTERAIQIAN